MVPLPRRRIAGMFLLRLVHPPIPSLPGNQVLEPVRIFYFQIPKSLFLSIPKALQALNGKEICRNQALEPQTNEFIWNLTLVPVLSSMFLYGYLTAKGPFE